VEEKSNFIKRNITYNNRGKRNFEGNAYIPFGYQEFLEKTSDKMEIKM